MPQPALPVSAHFSSGSSPAGTSVQVPAAPVSAQDWQVPVHSLLQQTPCAQIALLQSSPTAQAAPSGFLPQLSPSQKVPAMQSELSPQVDRQSLPVASHW